MSGLSEKQVNDHVRQAVSALTPTHAEEIWSIPVEKADSDAWFLEGTEVKQKHNSYYIKWAGMAAACFAFIFLGWFQLYRVTDITVYLDVNPSISLNVNRMGKVVEVIAENQDGRIILGNMDLRNTDVEVAMNALLGSMVKHGYLSQTQNIVLISVNGKNPTRTESLRQKLSADAEQMLTTLLGSAVVLGQTVTTGYAEEEIAEIYSITPGKAALILCLVEAQPSWDISDLAAMSMSELIKYCQSAGINISECLGENGEVFGNNSYLLNDNDQDDKHFEPEDDDQDDKPEPEDDDQGDKHFEPEDDDSDDRF